MESGRRSKLKDGDARHGHEMEHDILAPSLWVWEKKCVLKQLF